MSLEYFNPLEKMKFGNNVCFLTGEEVDMLGGQYIQVFPQWLVDRYDLDKQMVAMLGGNRVSYGEMHLPASPKVIKTIQAFDALTEKAFTEGYEAVKKMPELVLFQWMARILYGVLYYDIIYAIQIGRQTEKEFKLSGLMSQKVKNIHLALQSLVLPIHFDNFTPWTIKVNPVKYSKDIFNYKDEARKLNFCIAINGFGIAACMQDNGEVGKFLKETLSKVGDHLLHPAQFEELYGKFLYANYIMREPLDYQIIQEQDQIILQYIPQEEPLFAEWKEELYAQVLTNLLMPWGLQMKDVYVPPNPPISFLINHSTHEFIQFENINLPY
ncbi:MAG: hypothetical protein M9887_05835 [Chitinophagales bacterium]|nr:hypothetical protein [Chitinophagales bacterium]